MNGVFTIYFYITLTWSWSCVPFLVLSYWFGQWRQTCSIGFCRRSRFSMPYCVSAFFVWRSRVFRI